MASTISAEGEQTPWKVSVLLPLAVLEESPSARDGVPEMEEVLHRAWGCTLICEAGCLLKLPQVVVATAQNLLHRFYWRKSLKDPRFDALCIAMGALFLATKIEEKLRTLRQILYVFHHVYRRRKFCGGASNVAGLVSPRDARKAPLELGGPRYTQWKKKLIETERHLLKELGFGFYQVAEHPHKLLLYFIKYLVSHGMDDSSVKHLAQHAWSVLNDSMRLDLCVKHETRDIASAAMLIASRHPDVNVTLPSPHWMEALGATPARVEVISDAILRLYESPMAVSIEPMHEDSFMSSARQEGFDAAEEGRGPVKSIPDDNLSVPLPLQDAPEAPEVPMASEASPASSVPSQLPQGQPSPHPSADGAASVHSDGGSHGGSRHERDSSEQRPRDRERERDRDRDGRRDYDDRNRYRRRDDSSRVRRRSRSRDRRRR